MRASRPSPANLPSNLFDMSSRGAISTSPTRIVSLENRPELPQFTRQIVVCRIEQGFLEALTDFASEDLGQI